MDESPAPTVLHRSGRVQLTVFGKERVERLMRENGIRARHKRRYKVTTDSKHGLPVAENLLDRNFTPAAPNQVWTSDITYRTPSQRSPPARG
jgi:transposase InsO family protein